jgi:hypothetical protein
MLKLVAIVLAFVLLVPAFAQISAAALVNPATIACGSGSLLVSSIPESLTARTSDGRAITLSKQQLTRAATIMTIGAQTPGIGRDGVRVALMAALAESTLRMLANPRAYPESTQYPNDGDGFDHDSLGLFQLRVAAGWGSVAELMDPAYQAKAFFGGPSGPNAGSPRGLLDIPGWTLVLPGEAAQSVEVSAFPDRYEDYQPVANSIFAALTQAPSGSPDSALLTVPETSRVVFPLPAGSYTNADSFGWRTDPFTGRRKFHAGSDFPAPRGTPILAVADGVVTFAGPRSGFGELIIVDHTVSGEMVQSFYGHMYDDGIYVARGDSVAAGQQIGEVGSAGRSTGPHLHLEVHIGTGMPAVNAADWLANHGATDLSGATVAAAGCNPDGNL